MRPASARPAPPPEPAARAAPALRRALPWLACAGPGLVPAAYLATGRTLVWRDTETLLQPMRALVEPALRAGRLPLWNPHEMLGMPLLAQLMHGVLHPLGVLGALFLPGAGLDWAIVAAVVLAGLGAGVLAGRLGADGPGAAVAGIGFALSGYVLAMSATFTYLAAAATAPWAIAGLLAAAEGGGRGLALGAGALALLHLAGDPQWTLVAVAVALALAGPARGPRGLLRLALATALGTAIAGVQLLPAGTYLPLTRRAAGLGGDEVLHWELSPWRLPELVLPGMFGGAFRSAQWPVYLWLGGPRYAYVAMPFVTSVFCGLTVVTLAAVGAQRSRTGRALGIAALLLLWLALGHAAGAGQLLGWVPVWRSFRFSEKLVGAASLCLALAAGLGAAAPPPRSRAPELGLAGGGALALLGAALLAALAPAPAPDAGVAGAGAAALQAHLAVGLAGSGVTALLLAGLLRARRGGRLAATAGWALAALVFLEGAAASRAALRPWTPAEHAEPPPPIAATAEVPRVLLPLHYETRLLRKDLDPYQAETGLAARLGTPSYNALHGIDQLTTASGFEPAQQVDLLEALGDRLGPARWRAYRRFAPTHAVVTYPVERDDFEMAKVAVQGGRSVWRDDLWKLTVWEVPHRPWAAFAGSVVLARDRGDALAQLVEEEARGGDAVVLEASEPPPVSPGRVVRWTRRAERVELEAEASGPGLLVVNDAFWPGWTATLDGAPIPIVRADAAVRAVAWPAGRHVLRMTYDPPEVRWGIGLSLAGIAAAAALVLGPVLRRRLAGAPGPG